MPSPSAPLLRAVAVAMAALAGGAPATATDLHPALVADFTRQVQPLLLNKCAAGACHGGTSSPAPRLQRAGVSGQFDRGTTLANIAAFDEAIRRSGSPRAFLTTISGRHPARPGSSRLLLAPLTPAERTVLERWLVASAESRPPPRLLDPQPEPDRLASEPAGAAVGGAGPVRPAATSVTKPNRFRALIDRAANPLPLPPPEKPPGVLLGPAEE